MRHDTFLTEKLMRTINKSPWPFVNKVAVRAMIREFMYTREQYENIIAAWRNDFSTKLYEWKEALRQCDSLQKERDALVEDKVNQGRMLAQLQIQYNSIKSRLAEAEYDVYKLEREVSDREVANKGIDEDKNPE